MQPLLKKIQINIPFSMLFDTYLENFIQHGLNPEIGIDAVTLERFSNTEFLDYELHSGLDTEDPST